MLADVLAFQVRPAGLLALQLQAAGADGACHALPLAGAGDRALQPQVGGGQLSMLCSPHCAPHTRTSRDPAPAAAAQDDPDASLAHHVQLLEQRPRNFEALLQVIQLLRRRGAQGDGGSAGGRGPEPWGALRAAQCVRRVQGAWAARPLWRRHCWT